MQFFVYKKRWTQMKVYFYDMKRKSVNVLWIKVHKSKRLVSLRVSLFQSKVLVFYQQRLWSINLIDPDPDFSSDPHEEENKPLYLNFREAHFWWFGHKLFMFHLEVTEKKLVFFVNDPFGAVTLSLGNIAVDDEVVHPEISQRWFLTFSWAGKVWELQS